MRACFYIKKLCINVFPVIPNTHYHVLGLAPARFDVQPNAHVCFGLPIEAYRRSELIVLFCYLSCDKCVLDLWSHVASLYQG